MKFEKLNGDYVELKDYTIKYLRDNPKVSLYIGTDAKRRKRKHMYITTVCFRHPCNGVHVICKKQTVPNKEIHGIFDKLWREVVMTVDVLNDMLLYIPKEKITVDLDYSVIKKYESNKVHDSAVGWVKGLGVNVRSKPNAWAASYAADYLSNTYKL